MAYSGKKLNTFGFKQTKLMKRLLQILVPVVLLMTACQKEQSLEQGINNPGGGGPGGGGPGGGGVGPGGGGVGQGSVATSSASAISQWVADNFTATTVDNITLYDLTQPKQPSS
jgi:hypothetical protein